MAVRWMKKQDTDRSRRLHMTILLAGYEGANQESARRKRHVFKSLFGSSDRATKAYGEAVEPLWTNWKTEVDQEWKTVVTLPHEAILGNLIYRRLMSEFWIAVLAEEAFWERLDLNRSFQEERGRRQAAAVALAPSVAKEATARRLEVVPPPLAPLVVARSVFKDEEYGLFLAYENAFAKCTNIALQQIPIWRQKNDDRKAWNNEDLSRLYAIHDAKFIRAFTHLKKTLGWDEIPVGFHK